MPKACDACQVAAALVYCKADAAYLCGNCDSKVHGANKLASRHERVWMCEVCEMAPAAITCKADAAALCPACDRDIHSANPLARRHERVPITPFVECPSMVKVAHIQPTVNAHSFLPDATSLLRGGLFDGLGGLPENVDEEGNEGGAQGEEGDEDPTAAEAASWILPRPGSQQRPTTSSMSNPLARSPMVPNLSLGMASLGMFPSPYQQLPHRSISDSGLGMPGLPHTFPFLKTGMGGLGANTKMEPAASNPDILLDIDPFLDLEKLGAAHSGASHQAAAAAAAAAAGLGAGALPKDSIVPGLSDATQASPSISNTSSFETMMRKQFPFQLSDPKIPGMNEAGVVPEGRDGKSPLTGDGLPTIGFDQLPSSARLLQLSHLQPMAREARVMRYREKKKNRKFEKTIRYASRKAYAESRPRIKGRFAKRSEFAQESGVTGSEGGSSCGADQNEGFMAGFHFPQ